VKKVDLFYVLPLLFRRTKAGEKKFGPNLLTFSAIKGTINLKLSLPGSILSAFFSVEN